MEQNVEYRCVKQIKAVGDSAHKLKNSRVEEASEISVVQRCANRGESAYSTWDLGKKTRSVQRQPEIASKEENDDR